MSFPVAIWRKIVTTLAMAALLALASASAQTTPGFTIPASEAAGAALGAVTEYKIATAGWPAYETVATLAIVNALQKKALGSGTPLSAANVSAVVTQVKGWLDGRAPVQPFADQADGLRVTIDLAISLLATQAPANALEAQAMGDVATLKYRVLENSVDLTRQTPSDMALESTVPRAPGFVVDILADSCNLAAAVPQFGTAVNPILTAALGFNCTASYAALSAAFPNVVPVLPAANPDGSFTLNEDDLMGQYQTAVGALLTLTDSALNSAPANVHSAITEPAFHLRAETATGGGSSTSAGKPDDTYTKAKSVVAAISKLITWKDPVLGKQVGDIGGALVTITQNISGLSGAATALEAQISSSAGLLTQAGLDSLLGLANPLTAIVGGAVAIFQSLSGGSSAATASELSKISKQISQLQTIVISGFQVVNKNLGIILAATQNGFAQIDYNTGTLTADANSLLSGLLDVQTRLNLLATNIQQYAASAEEQADLNVYNGCLGYESIHGAPMTAAQYSTCEAVAYTATTQTSSDAVNAGPQPPDCSDAGLALALGTLPAAVTVNEVSACIGPNLGGRALSAARLPNPDLILLSARIYEQLEFENQASAASISPSREDPQIAALQALDTAMRSGNSSGTGAAVVPNAALKTGPSNAYANSANAILTQISSAAATFVANPAVAAAPFNLFGGNTQKTGYVIPEFTAATIPSCNGAAGGQVPLPTSYSVPAGIAAQLAPSLTLAEQLLFEKTTWCLAVGSTYAGATPLPGVTAKFAFWTFELIGKLNGAVVFDKAAWALTYENYLTGTYCGSLWETGGNPTCEAFLITLQPIGNACTPLSAFTAKFPGSPAGAPALTQPTAGWLTFAASHPNYQSCYTGHTPATSYPLKNYFATGADVAGDTSALTQVAAGVDTRLAALQQAFYSQLGTAAMQSGPLQNAMTELSKTVAESRNLSLFAFPTLTYSLPGLSSLFFSGQPITDGPAVQNFLTALAGAPISDVTHNKAADLTAVFSADAGRIAEAFQTALSAVQAQGAPDVDVPIVTIERDLESLRYLKAAKGLSPCNDIGLSPTLVQVPGAPATAALTLNASAACVVTGTALSPWLTVAATSAGSVAIAFSANTTGAVRTGYVLVGDRLVTVVQTPAAAGSIAPDAPTPLSPANGAVKIPLSTTLSVDAVAGATGYTFLLGTSAASLSMKGASATPTYTVSGLNPGTTYFWAATAQNGAGASKPSAVWSFSTLPAAAPTAPVLAQLNPGAVPAGSPALLLTMTGSGFDSKSTVVLNGATLTPISANSTTITVTIPASAMAAAGSLAVSVKSGSGAVSNVLNLTVGGPAASTGLSIVTSSLPTAAVGTLYSIAFQAAGGVGPYVWQVNGNLPPGLSLFSLGNLLNGIIEGTPKTAGTYAFSMQVKDAGGITATANFTLVVGTPIAIASLGNAASYDASHGVAPGEIAVLFCTATVGAAALFELDATGKFPTSLGGVQVAFDGVPAPLIYVQPGQIGLVVPYEVFGKPSTRVTVSFNGETSEPLSVNVVASQPGIFSQNASGSGPGAILDQDGSLNSSQNPATAGSVVVIYATGEGQTGPAGIDGALDSYPAPAPVLSVGVSIGGLPATVQYAGGVAGLVAGLIQINAVVPKGVAAGAVPVIVTVGTASSKAVTVAIH